MILGDQHICKYESLNIEFKEFCFNLTEIDMDCLNIEKICKIGVFSDKEKKIFNDMIFNNMENYFIKYIPRYLSAFLNSNIDNAELYFGVDDYGEITGIPFFGTKKTFENFIYNIINLPLYYINSNNKSIQYKVVIEELEIDKNYLKDNSNIILKNFYNDKNKINILRKKYKIDRMNWVMMLNEYTCKLPLLLETKKKEFDYYLSQKAPHLLNYTIYSHEMRNIAHLKIDPSHYIYWLMMFKEEHLNKIQSMKPFKPRIPKINQGPTYLINNLTELRSKMINNNDKLNYFILKIVFPSNSNDYDTIYYRNDSTWLTKQRHYNENVGPCCL